LRSAFTDGSADKAKRSAIPSSPASTRARFSAYKNLGAFDLDRVPGTAMTGAEREAFRELFGRVAVVEVTGGVDFGGLVGVVDKLLSA
jgi:hypothetical protein